MEFKVLKEIENPYLNRKEILIRILHEADKTPSKKDIAKYLADTLSLDLEKTIILYVKTYTGTNVSDTLIYYYPNGIDWSQIEPPDRKKLAKNFY